MGAAAPPADGLVARVRELAPFIAERAEQAERDRKPVDEVITALKTTGVFRSYVPRRFGGYEIDTDTFIDVGLAVSEACTSTGWVTCFYMEHNWMLAQFPPDTQREVFGAQPYVLAPASITASGAARAVDGGYVLSGRWKWGTGIMHADWVLLSGTVAVDDTSPPDLRMFLVRRDQVEVDDTWYAAGMEGTGSNDIVVSDLFVPAGHSEPLAAMAAGRGSGAEWLASPCYRHPMVPLLCIAAGVPAVGAARRAVQVFHERLGSRTLFGTFQAQAERAAAQMRLGNATVQVDTAERQLRAVGHALTEWGARGDECPPLERMRLRTMAAQAVVLCRDVVRSLMEASGASAHLHPHPMQRIHRDVHTLACHAIFDLDTTAENYGRLLLGMAPTAMV